MEGFHWVACGWWKERERELLQSIETETVAWGTEKNGSKLL